MTGEMTDRSNQDLAFASLHITYRTGQIIGPSSFYPLPAIVGLTSKSFFDRPSPRWTSCPSRTTICSISHAVLGRVSLSTAVSRWCCVRYGVSHPCSYLHRRGERLRSILCWQCIDLHGFRPFRPSVSSVGRPLSVLRLMGRPIRALALLQLWLPRKTRYCMRLT